MDTKLDTATNKQLSWVIARQKRLNKNVANVDTPGYRRQDLKSLSFDHFLQGNSITKPSVAVTSSKHLRPGSEKTDHFQKTIEKNTVFSQKDTGVSPEAEMIQISGNVSRGQFLMNLTKKWKSFFETALGKNGGA